MLRIKITNANDDYSFGALRRCFSGLLLCSDVLRDYSIELVTDNSYDFEFIDKRCFMDRKLPLEQSIDMGVKFLENRSGDYYLFDAGDCSSLMGSIEVFRNSNAVGLVRPQLLAREDYKTPSFLGRWFYGMGDDLNVSYDISEDEWNKIHLSGYHLGFQKPELIDRLYTPPAEKDLDVCAIFKGKHPFNKDYGVENHQKYTNHRLSCWEALSKINSDKIIYGEYPHDQYMNCALRSKIGITTFGQGEPSHRDFELVQAGCLLIKPDLGNFVTKPNWLVANETYIPVKYDWSDLNETIQNILHNFEDYKHIIETAQTRLIEMHKLEHVCQHWYEFFSNSESVVNEKN